MLTMILYHGTSRVDTYPMVGPPPNIDVTRGGGELGRGFYMGESLALAMGWAKGRYGPDQGCALIAEIDDGQYFKLHILTLNHNTVLNTWQQLRYNNTERTYLFHVDVVYGPLATYQHVAQHKFESDLAQTVLNDHSYWRVID